MFFRIGWGQGRYDVSKLYFYYHPCSCCHSLLLPKFITLGGGGGGGGVESFMDKSGKSALCLSSVTGSSKVRAA